MQAEQYRIENENEILSPALIYYADKIRENTRRTIEIAGGAAADFALGKGVEHGDAVGCRNGQDVTYVLPQRIDRRPGGSVKVFFRVAREMRNCRAVAESGGKVLAERRRRIVVPGEMETLLIPEEKLAEADGEIVVRIAED